MNLKGIKNKMFPDPTTKRMCIAVFGHGGCGKTRAAVDKLVELNWPFRYISAPQANADQQEFLSQVAKWDKKSKETHRTYPQILIFEGGDKKQRFKSPNVLGSDDLLKLLVTSADVSRASALLQDTTCKPLGSGKVKEVQVLVPPASDAPTAVHTEMEKFESFFYQPQFPDTTGLEDLTLQEENEFKF
jgi:hypothetical protein